MKKIAIAFLLVGIIFNASKAFSSSTKMIFWYPGEAGSTEEARPVLRAFFEYLKEKDGSLVLDGSYFNTDEGLSYIKGKKPEVGILSFFAWTNNRKEFPDAEVLLTILPKPYGKGSENYALVGTGDLKDDGAIVFTSEPLTADYVRSNLFADLPASVKLTQTASIMQKLKAISSGESPGFAILTPIEAYTLGQVSSEWAKNLKTVATSKPVPSARLILLQPDYKDAEKLKSVLLQMQNDPGAKDILDELRLVGFTNP